MTTTKCKHCGVNIRLNATNTGWLGPDGFCDCAVPFKQDHEPAVVRPDRACKFHSFAGTLAEIEDCPDCVEAGATVPPSASPEPGAEPQERPNVSSFRDSARFVEQLGIQPWELERARQDIAAVRAKQKPPTDEPQVCGESWPTATIGNGVIYSMCPKCQILLVVDYCAGCNIVSQRWKDAQPSSPERERAQDSNRVEASDLRTLEELRAKHGLRADHVSDWTTYRSTLTIAEVETLLCLAESRR